MLASSSQAGKINSRILSAALDAASRNQNCTIIKAIWEERARNEWLPRKQRLGGKLPVICKGRKSNLKLGIWEPLLEPVLRLEVESSQRI